MTPKNASRDKKVKKGEQRQGTQAERWRQVNWPKW